MDGSIQHGQLGLPGYCTYRRGVLSIVAPSRTREGRQGEEGTRARDPVPRLGFGFGVFPERDSIVSPPVACLAWKE